jgi:hypothetical protein
VGIFFSRRDLAVISGKRYSGRLGFKSRFYLFWSNKMKKITTVLGLIVGIAMLTSCASQGSQASSTNAATAQGASQTDVHHSAKPIDYKGESLK